MTTLTAHQLQSLFATIFKPRPSDRVLTTIVDVPDETVPDSTDWKDRREMAYDWWVKSISFKHELGLERVEIYYYPNVGSSNNNLPAEVFHWGGKPGTLDAATLRSEGLAVPLEDVLRETDLLVAPTEFSATAPCKMLAKRFGFR